MTTLEAVDKKIDTVRDEATRVQNAYSTRTQEINADTNLSTEGKRERLDKAYDIAQTRLVELKSQEKKLVDDEITGLEKKIDAQAGSTSTDLIAFRDAQDRAERLNDVEEADRMITRAIRTDDRTLSHAIFRRALEAGWRSTTAIFEQAYPDLSAVVKDLNTMHNFRERTMERAMAYSIWRA